MFNLEGMSPPSWAKEALDLAGVSPRWLFDDKNGEASKPSVWLLPTLFSTVGRTAYLELAGRFRTCRSSCAIRASKSSLSCVPVRWYFDLPAIFFPIVCPCSFFRLRLVRVLRSVASSSHGNAQQWSGCAHLGLESRLGLRVEISCSHRGRNGNAFRLQILEGSLLTRHHAIFRSCSLTLSCVTGSDWEGLSIPTRVAPPRQCSPAEALRGAGHRRIRRAQQRRSRRSAKKLGMSPDEAALIRRIRCRQEWRIGPRRVHQRSRKWQITFAREFWQKLPSCRSMVAAKGGVLPHNVLRIVARRKATRTMMRMMMVTRFEEAMTGELVVTGALDAFFSKFTPGFHKYYCTCY